MSSTSGRVTDYLTLYTTICFWPTLPVKLECSFPAWSSGIPLFALLTDLVLLVFLAIKLQETSDSEVHLVTAKLV